MDALAHHSCDDPTHVPDGVPRDIRGGSVRASSRALTVVLRIPRLGFSGGDRGAVWWIHVVLRRRQGAWTVVHESCWSPPGPGIGHARHDRHDTAVAVSR